jgi:hypothetical protein
MQSGAQVRLVRTVARDILAYDSTLIVQGQVGWFAVNANVVPTVGDLSYVYRGADREKHITAAYADIEAATQARAKSA